MKDKKILQVSCDGLGNGGVQKIIMKIKENMSFNNSDVVVFTDERRYYDDIFEKLNGKIYRIVLKNGLRVFRPLLKYFNILFTYVKLKNILQRNPYDIIHCHNEYESGICLYVAYKCGIKKRITHFHRSDYDLDKRIIYKMYSFIQKKLILKYSTDIICCSEQAKESFFCNIDNPKINVIYNSICFSDFRIEKKQKNKQEIILTNIGKYSENKNQMFLIKLAKEFKNKKLNSYKINLVGYDEEYKRKLENKVREFNLENVYFIDGLSADIKKCLSKTDVFLFPSKKEGFGISLLEAQIMKIPCIASDSITKESNIGYVKYLSLNNIEKWIDTIVNINDCKFVYIDNYYKFDDKYFFKRLNYIYEKEGEII